MFNRLLPRQADNDFQGYTLALWLFGAILLVLAAMSVNSVFNGHYVAVNADGLPLDTYTPAGGHALSPRGELHTRDNIGARLNMRDFLDTMRASGLDTGGPPPLSQSDRKALADHFDKLLTQNS